MKFFLFLLFFLLVWCTNETNPSTEISTTNNIQENSWSSWSEKVAKESNISQESIQKEVIFYNFNSQQIEMLENSSQTQFQEENMFTQTNTWFDISSEKDITTSDFINTYEIKGQASFWNN